MTLTANKIAVSIFFPSYDYTFLLHILHTLHHRRKLCHRFRVVVCRAHCRLHQRKRGRAAALQHEPD